METTTLTIRMPVDLKEEIKQRAEEREESTSEAALKLIKLGLEKQQAVNPSPRLLAEQVARVEAKLDALSNKHATGLKKLDDRLEKIGKVLVNVFAATSNLCKHFRLRDRAKSHHPLDVHPELPETDFVDWQ